METTSYTIPQNSIKEIKQNAGMAVLALILILFNAIMLQSLLIALKQDSNLIKQLWEPSEDVLVCTAPTFTLVAVLTSWIVVPKDTQFKKVFKVVGIITIILYSIALMFWIFISGLKFNH
jgi:hypothetical protein